MRTLICILIFSLFPVFSFGGVGGGGTGPRPETGKIGLIPDIVFDMGTKNGIARFGHGQLIENKWKTQIIEISAKDAANNIDLRNALKESASQKTWVPIYSNETSLR